MRRDCEAHGTRTSTSKRRYKDIVMPITISIFEGKTSFLQICCRLGKRPKQGCVGPKCGSKSIQNQGLDIDSLALVEGDDLKWNHQLWRWFPQNNVWNHKRKYKRHKECIKFHKHWKNQWVCWLLHPNELDYKKNNSNKRRRSYKPN